MKPIVGVVPSIDEEKGIYFIHEDNILAIEKAGGVPILIPYQKEMDALLATIDGLYLTGGYDIDPTLFGEEPHPELGIINRVRDEFESKLIDSAMYKDLPILAVCRGSQVLNIALGGDMYQDMYSQINTPLLQHQQNAIKSHASHYVYIKEGSLLHRLAGENKIKVNSRHHQANRKLGDNLIASGLASDGVIEAIESENNRFLLGLQWHPENMAKAGDDISLRIYEGFIEACRKKLSRYD